MRDMEMETKMKANKKILVSGLCLASFMALAGDLSFTISSDRADAKYKLGEDAVFTVTAKDSNGVPAKSGTVCWKLNNFGDKVFASGEEDLSKNGGTFTVKGSQTEPGFLRLDVAEKAKKPVYTMWGVVFDPEKIVPGTPNPPDFMDFWLTAIKKYDREVTEPIRVTEVERTDKAVMYELRIPSTQGRYVWGYFSEPVDKSKGPYPLTVTVPGAGPSTWGCRSMKANAMFLWVNVHYYDPVVLKGEKHKSPKCLAVQKEEDDAYAKKYPVRKARYTNCGIASSREDYFYYGVILAANRAVDWAASRPGVDAKHIGYSGISQGGGFGLILTSLNKHIRHARVAVPALTDLLGDRISSREAGWPRLVAAQLPENRVAAEKNAPYFCGVNFARHIDVPIGFVVGFIDTVCPPHAGYAAYNVCPSKTKAMFYSIGRGHDANSGEGGKALSAWMSNILQR